MRHDKYNMYSIRIKLAHRPKTTMVDVEQLRLGISVSRKRKPSLGNARLHGHALHLARETSQNFPKIGNLLVGFVWRLTRMMESAVL